MPKKKRYGTKMTLSEFNEFARRPPQFDIPRPPSPPSLPRPKPPKGGFSSDDCAVCLESLKVTTTKCGHKFHTSCLNEAYFNDPNKKCPVCRMEEKKNNT